MAKAKTKATTSPKPPAKITVNLAKHNLSNNERLELLRAVSNAVSATLRSQKPARANSISLRAGTAKTTAAGVATVSIEIRDTEPGMSNIRLEHNETKKQVDQTKEVVFENVRKGDTIWIEGHSLGTVTITVMDRAVKPKRKQYRPLDIIAFDFEMLD